MPDAWPIPGMPEPDYLRDGVALYCADCRDVMAAMPDGCVDVVVTDPPYGIGLSNNDRDGHRSARPFAVRGDDTQDAGLYALQWAERHAMPTVAFASPWKPWPGEWRNLIVWDKGGAVGGGGDISTCLKRTWELVQVARNGPMIGPRDESVWRCPQTPRDTAEHICAKPVALLKRLLLRFAVSTDIIFDPFAGSGTTLVAAAKLGRRAIGVELERKYFDIACRRVDEALDEAALFEGVANA